MRPEVFGAIWRVTLIGVFLTPLCMSKTNEAGEASAWVAAPTDLDGWVARHLALKMEVARAKPRVLFVGDSLTARWAGPGRAEWDSRFRSFVPFNAGVEGETTQGLLWRIQHGEFDGIKPQVVVLLIGTNNVSRSLDDQNTVKGIIATALAFQGSFPKAKVVVLGLLPRGEAGGVIQHRVSAINDWLLKNSRHEGYIFKDVNRPLLLDDGSLDPAAYLPDRLHLEMEGYARISPVIGNLIGGLIVRQGTLKK